MPSKSRDHSRRSAGISGSGLPDPHDRGPAPIIAIFEFRQMTYAVITATRGAPRSDTFPFFVGPPRDKVNVIDFVAGAV